MKFDPKTDEQIDAARKKLKAGPGQFQVRQAEAKVSKSGNDMIKLTLGVWDADGTQGTVFDYLVSSMEWKIKHFCESIGHTDWYEAGTVDPEKMAGKSGGLMLKERVSEEFGKQITVADYIPSDVPVVIKKPEPKPAPKNDSVPEFNPDEDFDF